MVENKSDPVEDAIDKLKPLLTNISFGGVMGYCSGVALKKVGKAVAFAVGGVFVALQCAVAAGYIDVDWEKVKDTAVSKVDATGDGKLNASDLKVYWKKLKNLLTHRLPSAGGFSLGFLFGMRYG